MSTPIEGLLEAVEWDVLPSQEKPSDGIPYATHHGFLTIMGKQLECYRLSDGKAIFTAESFMNFFEPEDGS